MRNALTALLILALLGGWGAHEHATGQVAQNPDPRGSRGGECAAVQMTHSHSPGASLLASDDVAQVGVHKLSLSATPRVVINVPSSWGGGKVEVPPDLISAEFTVENVPRREDDAQDALRFQITDLAAKVKSFKYPLGVITGENIFHIVKERSYVQLKGTRGVVLLSGEAEALLTNRLFSITNPAIVKMSFQGEYDFSTRTALLNKVEARANSPSGTFVPKFELSAQFSSLNTRRNSLTQPGVGGRLTYNVFRPLALEAEANIFPRESFISEIDGGRVTQVFVGLKAGHRFKRVGVFGTVKPGVQSFSQTVKGYLIEREFSFEPILGRKTVFALNWGGGVELCPQSRVGVRFDVGDTVTFHPGRTSIVNFRPTHVPKMAEHNLQVSVGPTFRF